MQEKKHNTPLKKDSRPSLSPQLFFLKDALEVSASIFGWMTRLFWFLLSSAMASEWERWWAVMLVSTLRDWLRRVLATCRDSMLKEKLSLRGSFSAQLLWFDVQRPVNVVIIKYCIMAVVNAGICPSEDIRQINKWLYYTFCVEPGWLHLTFTFTLTIWTWTLCPTTPTPPPASP